MGIPGFFKWLTEQVPQISHDARFRHEDEEEGKQDATLPNPNNIEFDNLYIDINGILHTCSHPDDKSLIPTSLEQLKAEIFKYLDRVFDTIRPRNLLFIAVDGVAPRAKLNQQRIRRFLSGTLPQETKPFFSQRRKR